MRKILFRGKRVDNGEFVYGCLYYFNHKSNPKNDLRCFIAPINQVAYVNGEAVEEWEVDPETVGEFSGKRDIKGTEVYESNIIEWESEPITKTKRHGIVRIRDCMYVVESYGVAVSLVAVLSWGGVVIGNEFDNPELLGKQPCS